MIRVGSVVGSYRLLERLGQGPFGIVWRAKNTDGSSLCVKLLRTDLAEARRVEHAFDDVIERWDAVDRVADPRIVRVYEVFQRPEQRLFGLSMEYVAGQDLSAVRLPPAALAGRDPRSLAILLGWFESIAEVLAALHARGLVHGSLKPSNVRLEPGPSGRTARILDVCWSAIGANVYSPSDFDPPEQRSRRFLTPASDQWALAAMLARILSGGEETLTFGSVPAVLVMLVQRAMDRDPDRRFPSIDDLLSQIQGVRRDLIDSVQDGRAVRAHTPWARLPHRPVSLRRGLRPADGEALVDEPTEPSREIEDSERDGPPRRSGPEELPSIEISLPEPSSVESPLVESSAVELVAVAPVTVDPVPVEPILRESSLEDVYDGEAGARMDRLVEPRIVDGDDSTPKAVAPPRRGVRAPVHAVSGPAVEVDSLEVEVSEVREPSAELSGRQEPRDEDIGNTLRDLLAPRRM